MDSLSDYVYAGAGCEGKQQQVMITFRPRAIFHYLPEITPDPINTAVHSFRLVFCK
jgi:hypothetical protein